MTPDSTWRSVHRRSADRLPRKKGAGLWLGVAVILAAVFHLVLWLFAGRLSISFGLGDDGLVETDWLSLQRVEVEAEQTYLDPVVEPLSQPEPLDSAAALLEELSQLETVPTDLEFEIRPDVSERDFKITLSEPALQGEDVSTVLEPTAGPSVEIEVPELGTFQSDLKESQNGRVIVDPGQSLADEFDPDEVTKELARKGLDALSAEGVPEGFSSLDALLRLDGNTLDDEKAMIGSDLLFEFNQSSLRQSARTSLMKVAMLIEKNPEMYCWLEGHTDTIGGDESNQKLSLERAAAVKEWLVAALKLPSDRIIVLGMGETSPLVIDGDKEKQAINRRVEIKLRKQPPVAEVVLSEEPVPPKAIVVDDPFAEVEPLDATESGNEIPVAVPVEEDIPVAEPVDEPTPIPAEPVVIPAESVEP